jgi:hypothetical protein
MLGKQWALRLLALDGLEPQLAMDLDTHGNLLQHKKAVLLLDSKKGRLAIAGRNLT